MKLAGITDGLGRPRKLVAGPGEVLVQWRCRGKHPGCEGRRWQTHSLHKEAEAAEWVKWANYQQGLFDHRVAR